MSPIAPPGPLLRRIARATPPACVPSSQAARSAIPENTRRPPCESSQLARRAHRPRLAHHLRSPHRCASIRRAGRLLHRSLQLERFFICRRRRLVAHHGNARFERRQRHGQVHMIRRHDRHKVDPVRPLALASIICGSPRKRARDRCENFTPASRERSADCENAPATSSIFRPAPPRCGAPAR
jgi:hypothetical protein